MLAAGGFTLTLMLQLSAHRSCSRSRSLLSGQIYDKDDPVVE